MQSDESPSGGGEQSAPVAVRLHPLSILFGIGGELRNLLVPALFLLFAARQTEVSVFVRLIVILALALIGALLKYFSYRIIYGESELIIKQGILRKSERHIPYGRIQSIDSQRNTFHQMFGVIEIVIQTAGGDEAEAKLSVLPVRALEEIRGRVFGRSIRAPEAGVAPIFAAVEEGTTLLRLRTRDLLLYGFIENRGMYLVLLAAGWFVEFGPFEEKLEGLLDSEFGERGPARMLLAGIVSGSGIPPSILAYGAMALVVLLLVARIFSMLWSAIRMHDFTVRKVDDDLRVEYGFFTRVVGTVPIPRVQVVGVTETIAHRLFGVATMRVSSAGAGRLGGGDLREPLVPILPRGRAETLIAELWPGLNYDSAEWRPLHPRAHVRMFRGKVIRQIILAALLAVLFRWWALAILAALITWSAIAVPRRARTVNWALTEKLFVYRAGWVRRGYTISWLNKVQVVATSENYFDRRTGMAALHVDTSGSGPTIEYLPVEVAREAQRELYAQAAGTPFRV